jgi:tetratricopeptide (TPR) repeat protein
VKAVNKASCWHQGCEVYGACPYKLAFFEPRRHVLRPDCSLLPEVTLNIAFPMSTFNITVTPCMEFRHLPIICFFTFLFASSIILIAMASRPHQIVGAVVFVGVLLLLRILVRPTIHALRRHHWPYDVGADKKLQLRLAAVRESDPSLTGWPHIRGRMAAFSLWLVIGRPMYRDAQLKELGDAFLARYDFHGEIPALDDAISAYEQSLSLRGEGHKRHGVAVGDLGRALWRSCRDNREDGTRLSQCVGLLDEAAQLHPPGHPARDIWLSTLAMASELLFKEEGGMNTLEKAIRLSEESLQLRVSSHPTREPFPQSLLNECRRRVLLAYQELFWPEPLRLPRDALLISLGGALLTRFRERRGDRDVLDKVLRLHREALQLRPFSHPARWDGLRHLAAALQIQCKQYGDWPALEEAIVHYKEALRICPPDFVHRGVLLNSYGETLLAHSHRRGQMHTVTQAIGTLREALQLHPPGHFARSLSLYGLAEALRARCEREGNWDALEQVILLYREALQLPASRDRIRGSIDNGLGAALMNRFRQQGRLDTLADAIQLHHEALVLHPHGHCDRGVSLNHLAIALHARFQQQGGMDVLGEAVSSLRQALQQSPRGHVARAEWLNNLADALESWFEWHGGEDTLSEAINLHREALNLRARGDPGRGIALSHLGRALQIRHSKIGDQAALTEAIDLHRQSLELCPLDHPARDVRIDSLAGALQTLASRTGDTELLGQAISLYRETLRLRPTGHPLRARTLFHVGECLLTRRVDDADFVRGIGHISEALTHAATGVRERLLGAMSSLRVVEEEYDASRKKGDAASWIQHGPFILKLYRQAIQLLPLAANLGLSPTTRLEIAGGSDELSRRGAARAVLLNHVPEAVEMLEEGRGVFWSQALQLRSSALDNLPNEDRLELEGVFHDLEATSTNFPTGFNQERERLLERQRLLSVQAEELISRVRAHYPGFDRLLMPPAFGDLVSSLPDGYVVIVNTARRMHHALLLHRSSGLAAVVKVQAPRGGFDCDDIRVHMPRDFGSGADEAAQQTVSVIRGGNVRKAEFNSFEDVLVGLWVRVVQPVIKTLGLTVGFALF